MFIQTKYLWFYILNRTAKKEKCFLNSPFGPRKVDIKSIAKSLLQVTQMFAYSYWWQTGTTHKEIEGILKALFPLY